MCVGDWRLGRVIKASGRTIASAAVTSATLRRDPLRVGLTVMQPELQITPAGGGGVFQVQAPAILVSFPRLEGDLRFYHFTVLEHGELPMLEWRFFVGSDTLSINIIEYFMTERMVGAEPMSWERR